MPLANFLRWEHLQVKFLCTPSRWIEGANGMYLISLSTLRRFFSIHRHRFLALVPSGFCRTPWGTGIALLAQSPGIDLGSGIMGILAHSFGIPGPLVVKSSVKRDRPGSRALMVVVMGSSSFSVKSVIVVMGSVRPVISVVVIRVVKVVSSYWPAHRP